VNAKNGWTVQPPTGGQFAHALAKVLDRSDQNRNPTWSSVPPVLLREGQKVQPQWLYEFLLNPHPIRPMVAVNLRMPRFNMSEDEAEALVHYFVAVDRLTDPALGTEYFTRSPVQREPLFQQDKRVTFRQRADQAADANAAKGDDYFEAGWRMLTSKKMCLNCHNIGTFKSEGGQAAPGGPVQRGPSLHMAADRLRPDYVERYVTYPNRIIPYTVMAQYPPLYEDYHKIADADFKAVMGESGPALSAHERLRAVRDALFSWGYLTDPQRTPTGQKAGPRGDAHSWE
jgi:cbb3-type cytochrome oxidase cytochrome c subunit